jgi:kynurenine formamidase
MDEKSCIEYLEYVITHAGIIDLTYTMETGMPAWPTQARYGSVLHESYDWGDVALHSMITMSEHTGTHIDAPKHFIKGGSSVDNLPPTTVMGRGVNVDATFLVPRGTLGYRDIKEFEAKKGEIKKGDVVMFRFGWDKKYRIQPDGGEYLRDWPGLAGETAEYLVEKNIAAAGCDTLALDAFGSDTNPAHHILLGKGIPIIENIYNLSKLAVFSYVVGLPNKFKDGSGSPLRLIAFVDPIP